MSSRKGGETTSKVRIPGALKDASLLNLEQAQSVSRLPYAPNFAPQIAAFTPMQQNAFGSVNNAASALGLPYQGPNTGMGMPQPQNVGGFQGYSSQPFYEAAQAGIPASVRELYDMFFNQAAQAKTREAMQRQANVGVPATRITEGKNNKKNNRNSSAAGKGGN